MLTFLRGTEVTFSVLCLCTLLSIIIQMKTGVLSLKICKDILKCLIEDCYTKFGPAKRLINISTTVLHWKLFVAN